jgi:hypothetical protein
MEKSNSTDKKSPSSWHSRLLSEKGIRIASWIQTVVVVLGVVFSVMQISSAAHSFKVSQNKEFLEHRKTFDKEVWSGFKIMQNVIWSGESLSEKEFSIKKSELPKPPIEIILNSIDKLEEISACGKLEVCSLDLVDEFTCKTSKRIDKFLRHKREKISIGLVGGMAFHRLDNLMDRHCSFATKLWHFTFRPYKK